MGNLLLDRGITEKQCAINISLMPREKPVNRLEASAYKAPYFLEISSIFFSF